VLSADAVRRRRPSVFSYPFRHWLTTFLAPYLLVKQFWGVLAVWAGVALAIPAALPEP
jgi:hypothetical protein